MSIFSELDKRNISRDSTIIAAGGGVVGDLAGFVASCWYRGTNLIHIPTSLLAAVDSTLGGKTAINFKKSVNAVGTYHHPKAVVVDTDLLISLPSREISSGFAEIIKYAAIGNYEIKDKLSSLGSLSSSGLSWYILNSLKTKEQFVCNDVNESSKRLYLNFGHTIGHAIEFSTILNGKEMLRHGEGVALGMLSVFNISNHLGFLKNHDIDWLISVLTAYNLPTSIDASILSISRERLIDRIIDLAFKDKKRIKKVLRLILLDGVGNPFLYETDDRDLIQIGVEPLIQ
jgi:3-dehydroquinate synthase